MSSPDPRTLKIGDVVRFERFPAMKCQPATFAVVKSLSKGDWKFRLLSGGYGSATPGWDFYMPATRMWHPNCTASVATDDDMYRALALYAMTGDAS